MPGTTSIAFGSSQVWTAPSNLFNSVASTVQVYHGGQGGGGPGYGNGNIQAGGNGGTGGGFGQFTAALVHGGGYSVVIGAGGGGTASFNQAGNAGGISSLSGSYNVVYQGGGGGSANFVNGGGGGGAAGPNGNGGNPGQSSSGGGGNGGFAGSGGSGGTSGNGSTGNLYGGAGGGSRGNLPNVAYSSGAGAQGVLQIIYQYVNPPTISSVSPSVFNDTPTQQLNVFGSEFSTTSQVIIAGIAASFGIISDTQLIVNVPVISQRAQTGATLQVINQVGSTSGVWITYIPNPPRITSLSPNLASQGGTTPVTINGQYLTTVSQVTVNGGAVGFTLLSDSAIRITPPAVPPQTSFNVPIGVTNPSGSFTFNFLTYIPAIPTITSLSQTSGDESGGYTITINGSSFTTTSSILFGTAEATNINILSDTQLTCVVPSFNGVSSSVGGTVAITLTNGGGSVTSGSFSYNFSGYPALNQNYGFV